MDRQNRTLVYVLVLAGASLIVATACYFLGGIIAEVARAEPVVGITFRAGGALAGFLISFGAMYTAFVRMLTMKGESRGIPLLDVVVELRRGKLSRLCNTFRAEVTIINRKDMIPRKTMQEAMWKGMGLTVHLQEIEHDDMIGVTLTDGLGGRWESDFFSPSLRIVTVTIGDRK